MLLGNGEKEASPFGKLHGEARRLRIALLTKPRILVGRARDKSGEGPESKQAHHHL